MWCDAIMTVCLCMTRTVVMLVIVCIIMLLSSTPVAVAVILPPHDADANSWTTHARQAPEVMLDSCKLYAV